MYLPFIVQTFDLISFTDGVMVKQSALIFNFTCGIALARRIGKTFLLAIVIANVIKFAFVVGGVAIISDGVSFNRCLSIWVLSKVCFVITTSDCYFSWELEVMSFVDMNVQNEIKNCWFVINFLNI